MKARRRFAIASIALAVIVVSVISVWTYSSPVPLSVIPPNQLSSSLISYSKSFADSNISDWSGSYTLIYGLDYSSNITEGSPTRFAVYAVLTSERVTSFFAKGLALGLQSSDLIIDGRSDPTAKVTVLDQTQLDTFFFENPNTKLSIGAHNITVRLLVSATDVGYIGSFQGPTQVVVLNGTFDITS